MLSSLLERLSPLKICDENLSIQKSLGYSNKIFKLKEIKCFSTEDIDKVIICNFNVSRSPVCLYDRNEAATTERKLDKAKDSNYTN